MIKRKLRYRPQKFRIYEREPIYDEIKIKLILNLKKADELVSKESKKIFLYYKDIEFYLENIAFGKKREIRDDQRKFRYKTVVDIVDKAKVAQIPQLSLQK